MPPIELPSKHLLSDNDADDNRTLRIYASNYASDYFPDKNT